MPKDPRPYEWPLVKHCVVHNLSHSDILVALDSPSISGGSKPLDPLFVCPGFSRKGGDSDEGNVDHCYPLLARPAYSIFQPISAAIHHFVRKNRGKMQIINQPVTDSHGRVVGEQAIGVRMPGKGAKLSKALGIGLTAFHYRGSLSRRMIEELEENDAALGDEAGELRVVAVYFPLWCALSAATTVFKSSNVDPVVFLISGAGFSSKEDQHKDVDQSTTGPRETSNGITDTEGNEIALTVPHDDDDDLPMPKPISETHYISSSGYRPKGMLSREVSFAAADNDDVGKADSNLSLRAMAVDVGPCGGDYDNSTQATAHLLREFIRVTVGFDRVRVYLLHSGPGIFKYQANNEFVNHTLLPQLHAQRREVVDACNQHVAEVEASALGTSIKVAPEDEDWHAHFKVTLSLSDGAPARVQALIACLRNMTPDYIHLWRPKRFFHEGVISVGDAERQTEDVVSTNPPLPINSPVLHQDTRAVVDETLRLKAQFESVLLGNDHELGTFWLRKTRKPVLAVLAIRDRQTGGLIFHHGMNIEVSMPTGTLCSERNAIGSALCANMGTRRMDFVMISVLSVAVSAQQPTQSGGVTPSRNSLSTPTRTSGSRKVSAAPGSLGGLPPSPLLMSTDPSQRNDGRSVTAFELGDAANVGGSKRRRLEADVAIDHAQIGAAGESVSASTVTSMGAGAAGVLVKSPTDLNPLAPCGACNEWLKKIAEANPDFRVITFQTYACEKVYVREVV
eukprot:Clim_evm9s148 gene=Clim_evmTU9s148